MKDPIAAAIELLTAQGYTITPPPSAQVTATGWQMWVERFFTWRVAIGSPAMRLTPADAAALKRIQKYLVALTQDTTPDLQQAYAAFDYILTQWPCLSPFLQSMIRLTQLEKYIEEIVMKLNPNGAAKTKSESARIESANLASALEQRIRNRTGQAPETDGPRG